MSDVRAPVPGDDGGVPGVSGTGLDAQAAATARADVHC